jgi:hypothetical protein
MTHKILDMRTKREITPRMESAMKKAYEEFVDESDLQISAPRREHLGHELRPGACCQHKWLDAPRSEEVQDLFEKSFEEKDVGLHPSFCLYCGAIALFDVMPNRLGTDALTLWAYDGTAQLGQTQKERPRDRRPERRKRA